MRERWWPIALVLVAALGTIPTVHAQGSPEQGTVAAREQGPCEGTTYCFVVTEGDLSEISPGDTVGVAFRNEGSTGHELSLAAAEDADPEHEDTPSEAAFATFEEIPAGASATKTVEVPADAGELYLWCDVSGHEQLGMWMEASLRADQPDGGDDRTGDEGQ